MNVVAKRWMLRAKSKNLANVIDEFQQSALSNVSPQTREWYRKRLALLARFLGEERSIRDIKEADLVKWSRSLEDQTLAIDTRHGYLRAARRLFYWSHERRIIAQNPAKDIQLPGLPRQGRKGISDNHLRDILLAAQSDLRDYALLLFLASTGARRGGVANLKLSDLNLDKPEPLCRQAQVFEKGRKERTVVMDRETYDALLAWLRKRNSRSDYVFISRRGTPLTADGVSEVVERYKRVLKIDGKCSPHQWRHRWFRVLISNGMPLSQAAQLGGHESVGLTYQFYGQFAMSELQTAYDKSCDRLTQRESAQEPQT